MGIDQFPQLLKDTNSSSLNHSDRVYKYPNILCTSANLDTDYGWHSIFYCEPKL